MAIKNDDIDWDLVRNRYDELRGMLLPFRLIGDEDIERYKLSRLTFGLIKSDLPDLLNNETVIEAADKERHDLWSGIAWHLSFTDTLAQSIPRDFLEARIDYFAVVEDAIGREIISTEFLVSWANLNEIYGRLSTLWATADLDNRQLRSQIGGGESGSILIQQHWYAHWMQANAPSLRSTDRHHEHVELAFLCEEIKNEKVKPWGPYGVQWYSRMVTTNDVDKEGNPRPDATYDLTTGLSRLSERDLRAMLEHPLITLDVLPPLNRSAFSTI